MTNPILLAIPVFFTLIALECLIGRLQGRQVYRLNDTLTNLHLGAGQVLINLLLRAPLLGIYAFCYESTDTVRTSWNLNWWSQNPGSWIIGILVMDFAYYWFHRFSHEFNVLWTGHSVHHQSEEYNLSVALRQSWIQFIWSGIFYLPLAFIGIPPLAFYLLYTTNTVGQFWIHTRLIGRLGPLEWFLNTPSHHRVHHGVDDEYIDKNYAGILIIWDRFFGTFEPEHRDPRYGVVKPLKSWNPVWANLEVWSQIWRRARKVAIDQKISMIGPLLRLALHEPAWRLPNEHMDTEIVLRTNAGYQLYDARHGDLFYTGFMGLCTLTSGLWVIGASEGSNSLSVGIWVVFHVWAGATLGALLDGRKWAFWSERIRLYLAPCLALFFPLSEVIGFNTQHMLWVWTLSSLVGLSIFERSHRTKNNPT